jgi:magnesium chelatase subunit I
VEKPVPVVDLPLGATEDRVVGALDLERALTAGEKAFEPGLLARANRGFLYVDEVNLLEDHLVDLLIDVAASGQNVVEREGLSIRHPARFVLVGSGNPEEGELRPQLLDRFGLSLDVRTPTDLAQRIMDNMFTFDDVEKIDDKGIQAHRREVQSESLVVALKGATPVLRDKIFKTMSSRAAETLKEDLDSRGPVRLSEVEAEQKEILKIVRRLVDEGQIVLAGGGDEQFV